VSRGIRRHGPGAAALAAAALAAGCRPSLPPVVAGASNGPVRVEVRLSTNAAPVGAVVRLQLRVDHPAGATVAFEEPGRSNEFRVRRADTLTTSARRGQTATERKWEIASFELGSHRVWTGEVTVITVSNEPWRVPLPELEVAIVPSVTNGDAALRPPPSPLDWPARVPPWVWALLVVPAGAAALAWAVAWWIRRRPPPPAPPPPPPDQAALDALERLRRSGAIEAGRSEYVYVELSRIMRHYVEDRFGLHAPERTTEEFLREAAESGRLTGEQRERMREFLVACDLVKFARAEPGPAEMRDALAAAERFVRETAPRREAPAP